MNNPRSKNALITVHKITIILSILGSAVFSWWSFSMGRSLAAGVLSGLVAVGLVIYLITFIKRTRAA